MNAVRLGAGRAGILEALDLAAEAPEHAGGTAGAPILSARAFFAQCDWRNLSRMPAC